MLRVDEDVAFGCENLGLPPEATRRRVEEALARLSLDRIRRQEVFTLSGGQKQRLAIAGALAPGTAVLLLDEPTSDLDARSRAELLDALRDLHAQGHTILMTEHRLDGLDGLVDRVLWMDGGRIVGAGPCPAALPPAPRKRDFDRHDAEVLVDVEGIEFAYPGRAPVLREITFRVQAGEVVALTGSNGSGKTTLLKILGGLLRAGKGQFGVAGTRQPSLHDLVGQVGFLFQNPEEQLFTDCVADEILFGPRNLAREIDLSGYLDRSGLSHRADAHPRRLARGERQRRAAAAVLAMRPRVLLLDEPTTGLDQPAWVALLTLIVEEARRNGACVLFSTHHEEAAEAFADRTLRISEGRLVDGHLP